MQELNGDLKKQEHRELTPEEIELLNAHKNRCLLLELPQGEDGVNKQWQERLEDIQQSWSGNRLSIASQEDINWRVQRKISQQEQALMQEEHQSSSDNELPLDDSGGEKDE